MSNQIAQNINIQEVVGEITEVLSQHLTRVINTITVETDDANQHIRY